MPNEVGYPYANFRLSGDLLKASSYSSDDAVTPEEMQKIVAFLQAPGSDIGALNLVDDAIVVTAEKVTMHQLNDNVKSFNDNLRWSEIDQTSIAHSTMIKVRGRSEFELSGVFFVDYATNKSYDTVVKDSDGYRLLFVERQVGRKLVALVQIFSVEETTGDDGELTVNVTFKNSGKKPAWV